MLKFVSLTGLLKLIELANPGAAPLKGNKGQKRKVTSMQNMQLQDIFVKVVLFPNITIWEILMVKV